MAIKDFTVTVTPAKIQEFIQRQEQLPEPNQLYIAWLKKQFHLYCEAEVKKADDDSYNKLGG